MSTFNNDTKINQLKLELFDLDREMIEVDGVKMKASQCYRLGTDPAHVLFNTNCPDALRNKIEALMSKYLPGDESSTS